MSHFEIINFAPFFFHGAFALSYFSMAVFALWAYRLGNGANVNINGEQTADKLSQILKYFFIGSVFQMAMQFSLIILGFTIAKDLFVFSFVLYLNLFLLGHIQFSAECTIKGVKVKWIEKIILMGRGIGAIIMLYLIYFGVAICFPWIVSQILKSLSVDPKTLEQISSYDWMFSVPLALGFIFYCSPVFVRLMLPSKPVTEAKILALLENCFRRAGRKAPSFWTIELDKMKSYNAMVVGLPWAKGPFQQSLLFSRGLLANLTPLEFESIMFHEIGHLALSHIQKRFICSIVTIFCSILLIGPLAFLSTGYFSKDAAMIIGMACYLSILGLQTFFMRRLIRYQEMEADAFAVFEMDSRIEDFENALKKLSELNHMHFHKKDLVSYFSAAAAHPISSVRIEKLRMRAKRKEAGLPLFKHSEWFVDLFEGRWKYFTVPATGALFAGLGLFSFHGYPQFQMFWAIKSGNLQAVQSLIERGREINSQNMFSLGRNPARIAAKYDQKEIFAYLVEHGADYKKLLPDQMPIFIGASMEGKTSIIEYLLSKNEDPNQYFGDHKYAVQFAAFNGNLDIVKLLVKHGANLKLEDDHGHTPLLLAAMEGQLEVVKYMIESGAGVNEKNKHGSTPLLMASYGGHTEVAKYLVEKGALLDELDGDGDSALAMASSKGFRELESLLRDVGAKIEKRQVLRKSASAKDN